MSASLLESLGGALTPDLLNAVGKLTGESSGTIGKVLGAALPTILSSIAGGAQQPGFLDKILGMANEVAGVGGPHSGAPGGGLLPKLAGMLLGGTLPAPVLAMGEKLLSMLYGNKLDGLTGMLGQLGGVRSSTASTLIGLAAPMVLSVIGDKVRSAGLNAIGLGSLFANEQKSLAAAVPQGLLSVLTPGAAAVGATTGVASRITDVSQTAAATVGGLAAAAVGHAHTHASTAAHAVTDAMKAAPAAAAATVATAAAGALGAAGKVAGAAVDTVGHTASAAAHAAKDAVKAAPAAAAATVATASTGAVGAAGKVAGAAVNTVGTAATAARAAPAAAAAAAAAHHATGGGRMGLLAGWWVLVGLLGAGIWYWYLNRGVPTVQAPSPAAKVEAAKPAAAPAVKAEAPKPVPAVKVEAPKVDAPAAPAVKVEPPKVAAPSWSFAPSTTEGRLISFITDAGKPVDKTTWFDFPEITFETASADLTGDAKTQVKRIYEVLKAFPAVAIKIGGYTDNTGDPDRNLKLSDNRARAVQAALVAMGIAADRLDAEGYGPQFPVASNDTEEGRAMNRRISLRVTNK